MTVWEFVVAWPLFILYIVVLFIAITGVYQLTVAFDPQNRSELDRKINTSQLDPVTILRPLKGLDSDMERTLRSSFEQIYDASKLEIIFCVQSPNDPCIPLVQKLISEYPFVDAKLMVDTPIPESYGPNPKINNLAKGYKAAKYDIIWIMDSNVWSRNDTLKRSIYCLMNNVTNNESHLISLIPNKRIKIITHIPLVWCQSNHITNFGAHLDEMFMATSHAKFYAGINRLQLAPCINGKSNIFKRSDLDQAVSKYQGAGNDYAAGEGIKYFSKYIGEDNMIGIALFDNVDGCAGMSMDMVVQPLNGQNSLGDYMDRRIRWLRVRKYMVLAATMIEPFTESLLSGLVGSFSMNVILRGQWSIWWAWYMLHMLIWFLSDLNQYFSLFKTFNAGSNISMDICKRNIADFMFFWAIREVLALPIWVIAVTGSRITWRGQPFRILKDLSTEML